MDANLYPGFASIIEQQASIQHERFFKSDLHIQAILFVARHQAGSARLVAHYLRDPQDDHNDADVAEDPEKRSRKIEQDDEPSLDRKSQDSHNRDERTDADGSSVKSEITPHKSNTEETIADDESKNSGSGPQHTLNSPKLSVTAKPSQTSKSRSMQPRSFAQRYGVGSLESSNTMFGMQQDSLAKLLAPSASSRWHLKKFEIKLGSKTFVSCPVFCKPHNLTKAHDEYGGDRLEVDAELIREHAGNHGIDEPAQVVSAAGSEGGVDSNHSKEITRAAIAQNVDSAITSPEKYSTVACDTPSHHVVAEPLPIQNQDKGIDCGKKPANTESPPQERQPNSLQSTVSSASAGSEAERKHNPLILFNVVLVVTPPDWVYHDRVEATYDHIACPLAVWLLQAQERERWVDKQIKKVELRNTQKQRSFPTSPIDASSGTARGEDNEPLFPLELLLRDVVKGLLRDNIVHLALKDRQNVLSLHVPRPTSSSHIPKPLFTYPRSQTVPAVNSTSLTVSGTEWLRLLRGTNTNAAENEQQPKRKRWLDVLDELAVETNEPTAISENSALVLLEDRDVLISQLQGTSTTQRTWLNDGCDLTPLSVTPIAEPMIYFIRHLTFRRTISQLTRPPQDSALEAATGPQLVQAPIAPAMPGLGLQDAQILACLLIRFGAARATLPIHASNIYIVSPTAPIESFPLYSKMWRSQFGDVDVEAPSLGQVLERLSSHAAISPESSSKHGEAKITTRNRRGPRPWASVIPKKSQKSQYMDMLSWLVARNWVAQIRTFAWVWVSGEVKQRVRNMTQQEKSASDRGVSTPTALSSTHDRIEGKPRLSWLSPLRNSSRPASAAGSTGSTKTAVRAPAGDISRTSSHETLSRASTPMPQDDDDDEGDNDGTSPSIIPRPSTASPIESRWISYIGEKLEDADARRLWPDLVQFFDGHHAVEEIAAMKGWKRALLASVFKSLLAEGVVRTVRHW